ncbi:MAG: DUF2163 domain-containing protein [Caulobacteraceae bacterium]|nr:DUF2163 domain-containing protein [Caulobacter sp.]
MRALPDALAATLDSEAATVATAWIVTRADGVRLGCTDHDWPLIVEGVACEPASGWTGGASDTALGFDPGSASAQGVLDSAALDEADIAAGRYDGAAVEAWRLDWSSPEARVRLWRGTVRRLVRDGVGYTAEIDGALALLQRTAGRSYDRTCDAALGDARCRVDPAAFPGASCDKRWATCTGVFANGPNFQGFPSIPGDDFLAVTAGAAGAADGGSRG